jgi:hypothetical protein
VAFDDAIGVVAQPPRTTVAVASAIKGQDRASHHGIDGNLKRAWIPVNGYFWIHVLTGCIG